MQAGAGMYKIFSGQDAKQLAEERTLKLQSLQNAQASTALDTDKKGMEVEELKIKFKELERNYNISNAARAYEAYQGGDTGYLVDHMKSTTPGVADVRALTLNSEQDEPELFHQTLASLKISKEQYDGLSEDAKNDLLKGQMVITTSDGRKVANNVDNWLDSSGVGARLTAKQLDEKAALESRRVLALTPVEKAVEATQANIASSKEFQTAIQDAVNNNDIALAKALMIKAGIIPKPKDLTSKEQGDAKAQVSQAWLDGNIKEFTNLIKDMPSNTKVNINGKDITIRELARQEQGDRKLDAATTQMMRGKSTVYKGVMGIRKTMEGLEEWNMLTKLDANARKITGKSLSEMGDAVKGFFADSVGTDNQAKDANKLEADLRKKATEADRTEIESKIFVVMADYIKAMSGAAVSEEERQSYLSGMGADWMTSKEGFMSATKGFADQIKVSIDDNLDAIATTHPFDYLMMKDWSVIPGEKPAPTKSDMMSQELSTEETQLKDAYMKTEGASEEDFNRRLKIYRDKNMPALYTNKPTGTINPAPSTNTEYTPYEESRKDAYMAMFPGASEEDFKQQIEAFRNSPNYKYIEMYEQEHPGVDMTQVTDKELTGYMQSKQGAN